MLKDSQLRGRRQENADTPVWSVLDQGTEELPLKDPQVPAHTVPPVSLGLPCLSPSCWAPESQTEKGLFLWAHPVPDIQLVSKKCLVVE